MPKFALKSGESVSEVWADTAPAGAVSWPETTPGETVLDIVGGVPVTGPVPAVVPEYVTKLQLRKACLETEHAGTNWWVLAKAALAAADENTQEEWELASAVFRNDATFSAFTAAIGATSQQVDAVFVLAATK